MSKFTSYTKFEYQKCNCRACPIGPIYNHVVPSFGNKKNPRVVLIGESPGETELKKSQPFCGRAGQLLRSTINSMGYNIANTLITNTIPCRPLNNKFPSGPEEEQVIQCVKKWLIPELHLTNPDFIILLGAQALRQVVGLSGITKHRGKWLNLQDWPKEVFVMTTFHPSYVLRMNNAPPNDIHKMFIEDLQKVATAAGLIPLKSLPPSEPPLVW